MFMSQFTDQIKTESGTGACSINYEVYISNTLKILDKIQICVSYEKS
jgi:hypothetical protein